MTAFNCAVQYDQEECINILETYAVLTIAEPELKGFTKTRKASVIGTL